MASPGGEGKAASPLSKLNYNLSFFHYTTLSTFVKDSPKTRGYYCQPHFYLL